MQKNFEKNAETMRRDNAAIAAGDQRSVARKARNDALLSRWKQVLARLELRVQSKRERVRLLKVYYLKSIEVERDLVGRGWRAPKRHYDKGNEFLSMKMASCVIQ